jgi:DNA-binding response OmpR family regulator
MEIAGKKNILVVDDEHTIANSLSWVLNMEGFETRAAYSGEEAIEITQSFTPDILICDVLMTGISGVETALQIREKFPSCHILLISGHVSMAELVRSDGRDGQFEFLSKPVHPRVLLEKLRALLRPSADAS